MNLASQEQKVSMGAVSDCHGISGRMNVTVTSGIDVLNFCFCCGRLLPDSLLMTLFYDAFMSTHVLVTIFA